MQEFANSAGDYREPAERNDAITGDTPPYEAPKIELPKGGGALKGIDEKFSVNTSNGTSSFTIPLPLSKGRPGFLASLSLGYNSGAGNSVFGLGWNLELPAIQRKTDKKLPQYQDEHESDVFVFSGVEDLVPALKKGSGGRLDPDESTMPDGTAVKRYRPRIEGGFSRIEKLQNGQETYWKVTTRENAVTYFGITRQARIADPEDMTRVYKWLPELSYDDKGNCMEYSYVHENLDQVPMMVHEKNRCAGRAQFANTYLKSIRHGNKTAFYPDPNKPYNPALPQSQDYFFEVVFDYADHNEPCPQPQPDQTWACRCDPFSDYRAGFEIRTYRLCRRILFFHYFQELSPPGPSVQPYLTRSLDFAYRYFKNPACAQVKSCEADFVTSLQQWGYCQNSDGTYSKKGLVPVEFQYQEPVWDTEVKSISHESLTNAPIGLSGNYQWVDFYQEGIPGILTEQGRTWYYKSNLGNGEFSRAETVVTKPSVAGIFNGTLQLQDLEANGQKYIVSTDRNMPGYYQLTEDQDWLPFKPFKKMPNVDFRSPHVKHLDLNGDGMADLLISEEDVFVWYPSAGKDGYDAPLFTQQGGYEENGPRLVLSDQVQSIYLSDMNGDGLTDIVRIRNQEVCYWPNLGYGRFGARVVMEGSPCFDAPEAYNPAYIQLADVNGTGAADLIYLGRNKFKIWLNQGGNAWSGAQEIEPFLPTEQPNKLSVVDLLGNGTACIVWSSPLPAYAASPMKYIDLMGGRKPYVMKLYKNNQGKEVSLEYRSSTYYYLKDKKEGKIWATKLAFPIQCVSRVETQETCTNTLLVCEYSYHHGYYDQQEREFRGFGCVEQLDSESYDNYIRNNSANIVSEPLHQPPVLTKTWYHTGAYPSCQGIMDHFKKEYYKNSDYTENILSDCRIETGEFPRLNGDEVHEAARACKGSVLRQEIYALDGTAQEKHPYSVSEHTGLVYLRQPKQDNRHAVFLTVESEAITYHYERNPQNPRIGHTLNLRVDDQGNIIQTASVAYGRIQEDTDLPQAVRDERLNAGIVITENSYTPDIETIADYRLRQVYETKTFELTGAIPEGRYFKVEKLRQEAAGAINTGYDTLPDEKTKGKRLIGHVRKIYLANDMRRLLPLGQMDTLGLHYKTYQLALNNTMIDRTFGSKITEETLLGAKYQLSRDLKVTGLFPASDPEDEWWAPSGSVGYPDDAGKAFYMPDKYYDPYQYITNVEYYSDYYLLVSATSDALGNRTSVEKFDFRVLRPQLVKDTNNNLSEVCYDIHGLVTGTAIKGKGAEGDNLDGFAADLTQNEIAWFLDDPESWGNTLLKNATSRFVYDLTRIPSVAAVISREKHHQECEGQGIISPLRYSFEYTDGLGRSVMKKVQTGPGTAKKLINGQAVEVDTGERLRWTGNGRTVYNNKGMPVKQFEPYFSVTHQYESAAELVGIGVSPVLYYDPLGRAVKTEYPNQTFSEIEFDSWHSISYDPNDTVKRSVWYAERIGGSLVSDTLENNAAVKTTLHDNTPVISYFDPLGRNIYSVVSNRYVEYKTGATVEKKLGTFTKLDIAGRTHYIVDSRNNTAVEYQYDMLGRVLYQKSMDSGRQWVFSDCFGKHLHRWDGKDTHMHFRYDELHRNIRLEVTKAGSVTIVPKMTEYGESVPGAAAQNLRGKVYRQYDCAGILTHEAYDFSGNLRRSSRQLCVRYQTDADWSDPAAVAMEAAAYSTEISYDALNRPCTAKTPDNSIIRHVYNESALLKQVFLSLRGRPEIEYVQKIDYNEKGRRLRILYGNNVSTAYEYDPLTFRLKRLQTTRLQSPQVLQDMIYTYDPVGNITYLSDRAHPDIYYDGAVVSPDMDYTYDALYRLSKAEGREHEGQNQPVSQYDNYRRFQAHPHDGGKMRRYIEHYTYDDAGNMREMAHRVPGNMSMSWTRSFTYAADDNRLMSAQLGSSLPEAYAYDPYDQGTMISMPHLHTLEWDYQDQLHSVQRGSSNSETTFDKSWYVYDSSGQRIRKTITYPNNFVKERIYLNGLEIYREFQGSKLLLERETLHIMDDKRRIAMIDTKTTQGGMDIAVPEPLERCQLDNHLGTACIELDGNGDVITYEEYFPFGGTAYQGKRTGGVEVPEKRYRYTGKERDEESGFYYHGARYYAPWLARWISPDPVGVGAGLNQYAYVSNNPVKLQDPQGTTDSCGVYDDDQMVCLPEPCSNTSSTDAPPAAAKPPPQPPARSAPREPLPEVSGPDTTFYVPPGFAYTQYMAASREADNPNNPMWQRVVSGGLALLSSPLALAEEYIGRTTANIPYTVHNAGISIGQHLAKGYLLSQQGADTADIVLEGLYVVRDGSQGFVAAASAFAPVSGALEGKLAAAESKAAGAAAGETSAQAATRASIPPPAPHIVKNKMLPTRVNGETTATVTMTPSPGILGKLRLKEPTFNPTVTVKKSPHQTTKAGVIRHESVHASDMLNHPQFAYMGTMSKMPGRGISAYIMEARGYYAEFGLKGITPEYVFRSLTTQEKLYLTSELLGIPAAVGAAVYSLLSD